MKEEIKQAIGLLIPAEEKTERETRLLTAAKVDSEHPGRLQGPPDPIPFPYSAIEFVQIQQRWTWDIAHRMTGEGTFGGFFAQFISSVPLTEKAEHHLVLDDNSLSIEEFANSIGMVKVHDLMIKLRVMGVRQFYFNNPLDLWLEMKLLSYKKKADVNKTMDSVMITPLGREWLIECLVIYEELETLISPSEMEKVIKFGL